MNEFKKQFSDFNSEYLIQMRARGLTDEANQAIEEIFAERSEYLPAKPMTPIFLDKSESHAEKYLKPTALIILGLLALGTAKVLAQTWIGVLIIVCVFVYFVINWVRNQTLTPEQKELENDKKLALEERLTEIMQCAVNGNLERIHELVEYGGDVNARSKSGATALMYAARNNHLPIVEFLLSAGADPNLKSDKNSTAMDIAKKFGYLEIATCLELHVNNSGQTTV